jgi:hypothetical protein
MHPVHAALHMRPTGRPPAGRIVGEHMNRYALVGM